jgi:hypothetical protein
MRVQGTHRVIQGVQAVSFLYGNVQTDTLLGVAHTVSRVLLLRVAIVVRTLIIVIGDDCVPVVVVRCQ